MRAITVLCLVLSLLMLQGVTLDSVPYKMTPPTLVVVRPSWSLAEIAQGVGMNLDKLMWLNGIQTPGDIYPGEVLKTYPYSDWQEVAVSWYEDGTTMADGKVFNPDDPTVVAHK